MEKISVNQDSIRLVGLSLRTAFEYEQGAATSKIGPCAQRYFMENIPAKIHGRKKPGTTYCVYYDYEDQHLSAYTFFIGEEISKDEDVSEMLEQGLELYEIPAQTYAKFNVGPGVMPNVVLEAWQKIWQMTPDVLGGKRAFVADFQIHDERSLNPFQTVLDIYVGIE